MERSENHVADTGKKVMLMGGTGFVGRHLVRALVKAGYTVTVPSRRPGRHRDLENLPGVRLLDLNIETLARQGSTPDMLVQSLRGHDALINLVGILNEPRHNGKTFERVHVGLGIMAVSSAHKAGVVRYLHMSALGADAIAGPSFYLRSKGAAEDAIHDFASTHDMAATSFRPSVIFGPGDSFLNRFASLARMTPGIFPLACADAWFAPVYVGDVCRSFLHALDDPASTAGQRIDLCGPQDYRLRDLVAYAARQSGHPRCVMPLPDWVARIQAHVLECAPGKPFTRDNYASMRQPSVCPPGQSRQPTRLEDIAPAYLSGAHNRPVA